MENTDAVSGKAFKIAWPVLNLFGLSLFLYAGLRSAHTGKGAVTGFCGLMVFVLSNVFNYYYFRKSKNTRPAYGKEE